MLRRMVHHRADLDHLQHLAVTRIVSRKHVSERNGDAVHPVGGAGAVKSVDCCGEADRGCDRRPDGRVIQYDRWYPAQVSDGLLRKTSDALAAHEQAGIDIATLQHVLDSPTSCVAMTEGAWQSEAVVSMVAPIRSPQSDGRTLSLGAAARQTVDEGRRGRSEEVCRPTHGGFKRNRLAFDQGNRGSIVVLTEKPGLGQMARALALADPSVLHGDLQVVAHASHKRCTPRSPIIPPSQSSHRVAIEADHAVDFRGRCRDQRGAWVNSGDGLEPFSILCNCIVSGF